MAGFERGRNLEKIGLHAQDTAELFFTDVPRPGRNLLGAEGQGFDQLVANLPQERLSIAAAGVAAARAAFDVDPRLREGPHGVRPADRLVPEHQVRAGRGGHRGGDRPDLHRPLRRGPQRRRARQPTRRPWPSGGAPSCRGGPSTGASSCTAATATCSSTRSPGAYADARITTIYGGTTEIMKEIIGPAHGSLSGELQFRK